VRVFAQRMIPQVNPHFAIECCDTLSGRWCLYLGGQIFLEAPDCGKAHWHPMSRLSLDQ